MLQIQTGETTYKYRQSAESQKYVCLKKSNLPQIQKIQCK